MKPQVIGTACARVSQVLDEALSEGTLNLPPELVAHASRCPRCGPEVQETEQLLARLRSAVAGAGLGRVPHVVDYVMGHTAAEYRETRPAAASIADQECRPHGGQGAHLRWVLGQVAVVAAALLITITTVTFAALKINAAISGHPPADMMTRVTAPFRDWVEAQFGRGTR
ncbi:MAG TPA: hypothetical protein VGK74_26020 [Symbiobacteriaceae bacterium]|jgi:hypothetical protein